MCISADRAGRFLWGNGRARGIVHCAGIARGCGKKQCPKQAARLRRINAALEERQQSQIAISEAKICWGERRGSNPRPPVPQTGALPAELRPPHSKRTFRENSFTRQPQRTRFGMEKITTDCFSRSQSGPRPPAVLLRVCRMQSGSGCVAAGSVRSGRRRRRPEWW